MLNRSTSRPGGLKTALLRATEATGLNRIARHVTAGGIRILGYHGLCTGDEADFQPLLFMRASTFRQRVRQIRDHGYRVITLSEAIERLKSRRVEPDLVVITIDDGWHGIYRYAVPVLQEFGYPATVYLTTYYVEHQLPVLNVLFRYMCWRTGATRLKLDEDVAAEDELDLTSRSARWATAATISALADQLVPAERMDFAARIASQLEIDFAEIMDRKTFHLMSRPELESLRAAGVDLQLHTHRHRFPPDSQDACRLEIERNRELLAPYAGAPLEHFCYPSGEYESHQLEWLRSAGITSATTTRTGISRPGDALLELPRLLDSEVWSPEEFSGQLSGVLEVARRARRLTATRP
jgi:peptidoglycan/xylan/chitin deacetylase (PgdA/CDA1 family)